MNVKKKKNSKQIFSVREVCDELQISRARYYQLMEQDVFPPPVYDIQTRQPLYTAPLKEKCEEIRQTGIGWNGRYVLFYSPRKKSNYSNNGRKTTSNNNSEYDELLSLLSQMGIEISHKEVNEAVQELFPSGIEDTEIGLVAREVFRYVKSA